MKLWLFRLTTSLVASVVALLLGEAALRIFTRPYSSAPQLQLGRSAGSAKLLAAYRPHRDLLWAPVDYDQRLAAVRRGRPDVVFMGDSCTQLSDYPARTMRRLEADGLRRFMNAGVAGWSSQQGVWQMTRDIAPLRPRVVTLYYGWNDHWAGDPGADEHARRTPVAFWLGEHSRIYQLIRRATKPRVPLADRPVRVSLPDYRRNLLLMADLARRAGSAVVFITAGSNHRPGHEPSYLRERSLVKLQDLVPLHSAYQRMTRDAAAEAQASLCDAAAELERDPRRSSYFREDGIHLGPAGSERLAELLAPCIREALGEPTE